MSMGLFGLLRNLRAGDGYQLIARDSDFLKASQLDGTRFQTRKDAEAAMKEGWPDVMPGPQFQLTGEGRSIAAAVGQFDFHMASDQNGDSVWIIVVEAREARNALRALKGLLRYWQSKYESKEFEP